ncbi:ABC-type transport system substrate-binding protein [Bradyrhizobium sp. GM22.5]
MDVQVEQQALSAWFASGINGEYSMTTLQLVGTDPKVLKARFMPGQYLNWTRYSDPSLQDLLKRAQAENYVATRTQLYSAAQKRIVDSGVLMPIRQKRSGHNIEQAQGSHVFGWRIPVFRYVVVIRLIMNGLLTIALAQIESAQLGRIR